MNASCNHAGRLLIIALARLVFAALTTQEHESSHREKIILFAGIPGTGKSTYCDNLCADYGIQAVKTDDHPRFIQDAVNSNPGLVARYLGQHKFVAVEWGFFPHLMNHVLALRDQGARLIWFNGEEAIARSKYSAKWKGDPRRVKLCDDQMERIREAHLPTADFQVVEVFRDGRVSES